VAIYIHETAIEHGWWDTNRSDGETILRMFTELAEAVKAIRTGNKPSEHIPDFSELEEELADVVIRILDFGEQRGLKIGLAVLEKMKFNDSRPYRHGGKTI